MTDQSTNIGSVNISGISGSDIHTGNITTNVTAGGDIVGGDKITVGNVRGSYTAIGQGAQVIVNQIRQARSAIEELEQAIQAAEQRLANAIAYKISRYTSLAGQTMDDQGNPYKALLDYELEDAPFFYGRAEAIRLMLDKLNRHRLTILHAESGSGKTSLLQAGLAARLLAQSHLPLCLRPYRQPPGHCIRAALLSDYDKLPELERFRDERMSLRGFLERVTHYLGDRQLFIFLDQFEEFFVELHPTDQRDFAQQLQDCVESDLRVRWVLALRKEYFSDLRLFNPLKPFENEYFLPTLTPTEAREVITAPAARRQTVYEASLVEQILADLGPVDGGLSPAQVQLVVTPCLRRCKQKPIPG